jgi:hypothetical protein
MGVVTTSDKKLSEAKDHINHAYKFLMEAIDTDTWGSDNYNKEYLAKLEEALIILIRLKRDL